MNKRISLKTNREGLKKAAANVTLVANAFIWYLLAFNGIKHLTPESQLLLIIGINTGAIALSGLIGTLIVDKIKNRRLFLNIWLFIGIFLSIVPLGLNSSNLIDIAFLSLIFGLYFGIGMPATMGYHSGSTSIERRAKIGGFTFLIIGATFAITGFINIDSIIVLSIILAAVRIVGLAVFHLTQVNETHEKPSKELERAKYRRIILNKSFILYFVPWLMIALVNFLTVPIQQQVYPSYPSPGNFNQLAALENVVIAIAAVFSGFIADKMGRKRLSIIGFIMLGIGYAVIGLSYTTIPDVTANLTEMLYPCIIFTITDGIAWGVFYVLFLFTIWGDLGQNQISDKLYFLGALPYISAYFMQQLFAATLKLTPSIIFTFSSVFLFLAVLPLLYAPETLPEKVMKDRDLQSYIEKAKKKAKEDSMNALKKEKAPREQADEKTQESTSNKEYDDAVKLAEKYY
jgi:MFS family permease